MNTTLEKSPAPGLPQELTIPRGVEDFRNLYTLFFHRGGTHHVHIKMFFHSGLFRDVIERAKKHCDLMNFRFIRVTPFISDLVEDEKKAQE